MTPDTLRKALRARLDPQALRDSHGQPFAFLVPQGPQVDLRFVAEHDTLCVAAALGPVMQSRRQEAFAQLMLANLYLADAGCPHYAITPHDGTVYLCCTVTVDAQRPDAAVDGLLRFVHLWQEARSGAHLLQILG